VTPARPASDSDRFPNQILTALAADEYGRVRAASRIVPVKFKQVLHKPGERLKTVYFPAHGTVVSVTAVMEDGHMVEVAIVGDEGVVGVAATLGGDIAWGEAIVRVPSGSVAAVPVEALRRELNRRGRLYQQVQRYTEAFLSLAMQFTACNSLHSVESRCCRWLLMTQDRVGLSEFHVTQELLSAMLGVRRPTVTLAVRALQRAGVIRYSRGTMRVVSRARLEAAACECYALLRSRLERLLPPASSPPPR
jgi:CRP-like cAMP-binding protein